MKLIARLIDSWAVFVVSLLGLSLYVAMHAWPASYWLAVSSVKAGPSTPWAAVPMAVDREIKQPFLGVWNVSVNRFGEKGWVAFCAASGTQRYNAGAELPSNLDLDWWTEGVCPVLPEGRYMIDTTWRIRPDWSIVPDKTVTARSNIFEVKP